MAKTAVTKKVAEINISFWANISLPWASDQRLTQKGNTAPKIATANK